MEWRNSVDFLYTPVNIHLSNKYKNIHLSRKYIFLRLLTQIKYKAAFFSFYFFFLYSTSLYFFHRRGEFYIVHDHIGPFLLFLLWIGFNIFHALFRDLFCSFIIIFFELATLMIFLFYLRKLRI